MAIDGPKHKEVLKIDLEERGLVDAWKTAVAFMNTAGGTLVLSVLSMERLANFFRGLEEEIKPPARVWQIMEIFQPAGKAYSFLFHTTGEVHKLRGVGTFVRSQGKNRKLSVKEKNVLIEKLIEKASGQLNFLEQAGSIEESSSFPSNRFFCSPLPVSSLQAQIAELLQPQNQSKDVFISYSHQDYALAHKLKSKIEDLGLSVWIDERILQPGDVITSDIAKGISKSKVGVVLVSVASKESYWVQTEISLMLFNRRFHNRNFSILPVLTDNSLISRELSEIIYFDLRGKKERKILEVAQRIKHLANYGIDS